MNRNAALCKRLDTLRSFSIFLLAVLIFSGCPQPHDGPGREAQVPIPSVIRGDGLLSVGWAAEAGVEYEVWYGTVNNSAAAGKWAGSISRSSSVAGTTITGLSNTETYYI